MTEGLAAATDTLLAGDRELAREVADRDELIDSLYHDLEVLVERSLLLQAPVASELRYLLSVLRIVPELERSGDLVEHIASRAARGLGAELTPADARHCRRAWARSPSSCGSGRPTRSPSVTRPPPHGSTGIDDKLDDLHTQFIAELAAGASPIAVAMEMALVGRFYERLGDHAHHIARRVRYLAQGS